MTNSIFKKPLLYISTLALVATSYSCTGCKDENQQKFVPPEVVLVPCDSLNVAKDTLVASGDTYINNETTNNITNNYFPSSKKKTPAKTRRRTSKKITVPKR